MRREITRIGLQSLILAAIFFANAPAGLADFVKVPGSRVSMDNPAGFQKADNFAGFKNEEQRSSIMVTELPAPFLVVTSGFQDTEKMAKRGMTLLSKSPQKVANFDALLFEIKQGTAAGEFHKWILAFGDRTFITMVTAAFPEELSSKLSDSLKKSVMSCKFESNSPSPLEQQEDMNFSLASVHGLKLAGRVQNALIYNESGELPKEKLAGIVPVFVAAQALSDLEITDKSAYALNRLHQSEGLRNFEIISESDLKIAEVPCREILALAERTEGKVFIYQAMLFAKGSYFILQGECAANKRAEYEPIFKGLTSTFKIK